MKYPFPFLSAGIGLTLMLMQMMTGLTLTSEGFVQLPEDSFLPPLMILLMNEFGMILCTVGAFLAYKMLRSDAKKSTSILLLLVNITLACVFAYIGYTLAVQTGVLDIIMNSGSNA